MPRALWLLIGLQIRAWLRFALRNVSSVRGVLVLLLGLFVFGSMIVSMLFNASMGNRPNTENLGRFGPLGLLAMCLMNFFLATGERVFSFRPAEVDFLFPGPFTRRQLLMYKVVGIVTATIFQCSFFMLVLHTWGGCLLASYLGLVLLLLFFQFLTLALTMLASTVGARAYSRSRRAVLLVLLLILGAVGFQVLLSSDDPLAALTRLEDSALWQVVRTPLSWFVKAFRAEQVWPDLVQYGALAALVDLLLVGVLFALDAQYLEASAAASERHYQRMQSLRSGQGVLAASSSSGKARFSIPMLPRLGGVGPTVWRQLLMVLRSYVLIFLVFGLGVAGLIPLLVSSNEGAHSSQIVATTAAMLIGFPILLTQTVLCDFRGDVDRMEVLKSLPIRPAWLAVGQLLTPSLVVAAVQILVAAAGMMILGRFEPLLAAVGIFALPANFVIFGIENMLYLLFPMRLVATSPGDFQTSGRYMLIFFAKFMCLGPVILATLLAALIMQLITESLVVALAAAWVVILICGVCVVPLVVLAFKRFDVATDTPT
jgi:hypothetical protein